MYDVVMLRLLRQAWPVRSALCLALVCGLVPALARAEPLDASDPTPRAIRVEFEVSFDPGTVGQGYSMPFAATYSAAGNTGTVVVSGAEYESAILAHGLDYFGALISASLIAGSASDFTLDIDLTTLEASARPFSYQLSIQSPVAQIGTVSRDLSTTATAGFAFLPEFPGFPFFCSTCVLVPGAVYDPITGRINAVGSDHLVSADIDLLSFSRAGDLRLSESAAPAVPALSSPAVWGLVVLLISVPFATARSERLSKARFTRVRAGTPGALKDRDNRPHVGIVNDLVEAPVGPHSEPR